MGYTNRHFRYFLRLISQQALLYTEMITTAALLQGNRRDLLAYHPSEHPLALQLGGSDPRALAQCARMAQDAGYDEVNLNVGCPSERVQEGRFGACLMKEPALVAACVAAMREAVTIPITVKTRIGVDEQDSYEELHNFVNGLVKAGCETLIVHARKAWLKGLSPEDNRRIPPLRYDIVQQLKREFPALPIVLNGGIKMLSDIEMALQTFDGVMLGRAVCKQPYLLATVDQQFYASTFPAKSRIEVIAAMRAYMHSQLALGVKLASLTRHIIGLFHGAPGANQWRRCLSEGAHKSTAGLEVIDGALEFVSV